MLLECAVYGIASVVCGTCNIVAKLVSVLNGVAISLIDSREGVAFELGDLWVLMHGFNACAHHSAAYPTDKAAPLSTRTGPSIGSSRSAPWTQSRPGQRTQSCPSHTPCYSTNSRGARDGADCMLDFFNLGVCRCVRLRMRRVRGSSENEVELILGKHQCIAVRLVLEVVHWQSVPFDAHAARDAPSSAVPLMDCQLSAARAGCERAA